MANGEQGARGRNAEQTREPVLVRPTSVYSQRTGGALGRILPLAAVKGESRPLDLGGGRIPRPKERKEKFLAAQLPFLVTSDAVVEKRLPSWVELHHQIKVQEIAGEHGATVSGSAQVDQGIIEDLPAFAASVLLKSGDQARKNPRLPPGIPVRIENTMFRPQSDRVGNLAYGLLRLWMRRIQKTHGSRKFGLCNGRVPEARRTQCDADLVREPPLQGIYIDGGIEKQFRIRWLDVLEKLQT